MQPIQPEIAPHTPATPFIPVIITAQIIQPFLSIILARLRQIGDSTRESVLLGVLRQGLGATLERSKQSMGVVPEDRGFRMRRLEIGDQGRESRVIVVGHGFYRCAVGGPVRGCEAVTVSRCRFPAVEVGGQG